LDGAVKKQQQADALSRLIDGLDFSREEFFELYSTGDAPPPTIPELDNEVWTSVSALNADLTRVRGELARLRSGVDNLRLPTVEAIGLDKLAESMRSIEARLRPVVQQQQAGQPKAEDDARLARTLKELLVVCDTLERVLELMDSQPGSVSDSVATGLRSVYQLLIDNLGRAGVKQAPIIGPFDPNIHLAVGTEPNPDVPSGHLSRVLQRGYYYNQQVLRTAQVVVAKNGT
jgi:molecular chaperone GrpE